MSGCDDRVGAVWRDESARIVAALTRMVRDVGLAEECAQDALVAALEQWPTEGVPDNPGAWLMAVSKRRALDHLRRSRRHQLVGADPESEPPALEAGSDEDSDEDSDDVLRLMFLSCHPVLPSEARAALTLRLLGGLSPGEIARAFLDHEQRVVARIAGAKRTLAEEQVPFELPTGAEVGERLGSVLEVVYLVFNEGYSATAGEDLVRADLCAEALRLGRLLADRIPGEAEVHGLVALMELQSSRSAARTGAAGEPVPLAEQDRAQWDPGLIRRGLASMLRARDAGGPHHPPGPYVLQAAIAVCHATARTAADTDWARVVSLYDALARLRPTPVVALNRAVALGMAYDPRTGLDVVDTLLDDPALRDYHLLPGVRGDLLARLGRHEEARREFARAASLTANRAERNFLLRRADALEDPTRGTSTGTGTTLGAEVADFLTRDDLDPRTLRSYAQTLRRLVRGVGERTPLEEITAEQVARVAVTSWGSTAPATWNRHRAALRSFAARTSCEHLAASIERRTSTPHRTSRLDASTLAALWALPDIALRERTLWRLLHESGAPVTAVLALDVEDLDLDDRRAHSGRHIVDWRSGTARLLPLLLDGRRRGPVFLTDRRPGPGRVPAAADLCPDTGHARLSYERAEYLFKQATTTVDPAGRGHTLRQLRPTPHPQLLATSLVRASRRPRRDPGQADAAADH